MAHQGRQRQRYYLALCACGQQCVTLHQFLTHGKGNPVCHYWVDIPDVIITEEVSEEDSGVY